MKTPYILSNRYQIIEKVGAGGLAEVYRAQDVALGREVALKVLRKEFSRDPDFLIRFHREAQKAAGLQHLNIVTVYDFEQDGEYPYIVMEYIRGRDLRDVLTERGHLSVTEAVEIAIRICDAVGLAHQRGLVHGDLKPGNILVARDGTIKVTDFGLARALGESAMDDGEVVWGTPAYFAPEQAAGERVLPSTDVYAIGIILYEMLTGRTPFLGKDDQEIARKHLYAKPIPINKLNPEVPKALAEIVDIALAKAPGERYLTADYMKEALIRLNPAYAGYGRAQRAPAGGNPATSVAARPAKSGPDWIALTLSMFAVLAVIGLVPIFAAVYRSYNRGVILAAYTPLPTLAPGQIRMPDLVGYDENTAKALMDSLGLTISIQSKEFHPTLPAFSIVSQTIKAGDPVVKGSTVGVIISQGPHIVEVPDVKGKPFTEGQAVLNNLDLIPQTQHTWSEEASGLILNEDPPPGSMVRGRTVVILRVASGKKVPSGAVFDDALELTAYELPSITYQRGEQTSLTLYWHTQNTINRNYKVVMRLVNERNQPIAEVSAPPLGGVRATSSWKKDEEFVDPYQIRIPESLSPGSYKLQLGLQENGGSAKASIDFTGNVTENWLIDLQEITVQ